eukprot:TRINITY_DN59_c0_g2_i3.p1 TRINITY_DN59_c0_g2~~TRINITY_DN59_c0_g2_i3.p1  ORF type:complete len:294 (+),score=73.49 TRINITY_DN59_c0_g2_i3:63-884(+)
MMMRTASIFAMLATSMAGAPTPTTTLTLRTGTQTETLPTRTESATLPTRTETATLPTRTETMTLRTATLSQIPGTPVPPTAAPGTVEQSADIYIISVMELTDLVAQVGSIQTTTTSVLGSTTSAVCQNICEMEATGSALTGACYNCDGTAQSRGAAALAPGRYRMWVIGRTALSTDVARDTLTAAIKALIEGAGGAFESLTVTLSVIYVDDSDDSLSDGAIAGIVIGCITFVIIVVALVYCLCCQKPAEADDSSSSSSSSSSKKNKDTSPDEA